MYGLIIMLSIAIGCLVAGGLMKKSGLKRETIIYTIMINVVSIVVFSLVFSFFITKDIRQIGFVAVGGAAGLLFGITFSVLLHKDHPTEMIASWCIATPLMYGLSKIACHIAGCCRGIVYFGPIYCLYFNENFPHFPIQLLEVIVFLMIFAIGLVLYLKLDSKLNAARITIYISFIAKFSLDFLRESHYGKIISDNQIFFIILMVVAAITLHFLQRLQINEQP